MFGRLIKKREFFFADNERFLFSIDFMFTVRICTTLRHTHYHVHYVTVSKHFHTGSLLENYKEAHYYYAQATHYKREKEREREGEGEGGRERERLID